MPEDRESDYEYCAKVRFDNSCDDDLLEKRFKRQ